MTVLVTWLIFWSGVVINHFLGLPGAVGYCAGWLLVSVAYRLGKRRWVA